MTTTASATIVVVARERFSVAMLSLQNILDSTHAPFELIYVDGGSPPATRDALQAAARQYGFRLLRDEGYLSPNEARSRAIPLVDTRYVVFVDNDLLVSAGWLDRLLECAEQTGAALVGPLYLQREAGVDAIHMAGGDVRLEQRNGGQYLLEKHALSGAPIAAGAELQRVPTGLVEFHCILARTEDLLASGGLDQHLLSTGEQLDLCLAIRAAGGAIYLEPSVSVTYLALDSFAWSDLPYFFLRWSDCWTKSSLEHLRDKWSLSKDDPYLHEHRVWIANYRVQALVRWRYRLRRVLGESRAVTLERRLEDGLAAWLERRYHAGEVG
ncbi:MAG TPA: glycosyltransferase [Candidatus Acidoferrales bacterium]|nr:glycosyltransferase [Candidatus Acidoferrales bacterium]